MNKKIRKAVIPVAGFGTRFLPATKAQPKEMLPLVDKPIIQYVVEDAVSAGIEDIILVTGWHKRTIEDYFDYPFELEKRLEESGKQKELEEIRRIADLANFYYVRQKGPMGNGTPIMNVRHIVGDEPFLLLWGDELMEATPTRSQQLTAAYEKYGTSILGAMRSDLDEDYRRYGYAAGTELEPGVLKVNQLVEKPGPGVIKSDYAIVAGYVFTSEIFGAMEEAAQQLERENSRRELYWADGMKIMLQQSRDVHAVEIKNSRYYDCGNKLEYMKAVVEFGLQHQEIKAEFSDFLKQLPL